MKFMKKFLSRHFVIFLIYIGTGIIVFWKLFFTFFQQDEWAIFGNYIYWEKAGLSLWDRLFVYEQGTHVAPLSNLFFYPQFKLFGMHFEYYAFSNVLIHVLNAYLLYILALLLTKNRKVSILTGIFFLVNSIVHQAVTWTGTSLGTTGSVTFLLLSFICLINSLKDKNQLKGWLLASLCWIISLLFKETSVFFILVVPVLWVLYSSNKNIWRFFRLYSFFIIPFTVYLLFRVVLVIFWGDSSGQLSFAVDQPNILVYFFRVATFPLKFIAQSFIPVENIIAIGNTIVLLGYPHFVYGGTPDPYVVETVASDIVSYVIAIMVLGLSVFLGTKKAVRDSEIHKLVLATVLSILLSSLPFIFIPGKAGYISLIDGRHLYLTSVFSSILLAGLLFSLYKMFKPKQFIILAIVSFIVLYIGINALQIRKALNTQMGLAFTRKMILQKIYTSYPHLPQKIIFYTESNTAFYGLPDDEKILPFQSGLGQTLLVWYNSHGENIPTCLFKSNYLYVLLNQDYKECDGKGFGYFRNFDFLKEAVKRNNLAEVDIVAFRYNSFSNTLVDITKEIQNKLQ